MADWDPHAEIDQHYPHGGAAGQVMDWINLLAKGGVQLPGGGGGATLSPLRETVLGFAKGVNHNVVGDNPIPISAGRYVVTSALGFNNVGGAGNYDASLYTGPNGTGENLHAYVPNKDGRAGYYSTGGAVDVPVLTEGTLYYRVSTPSPSSATGDIYVLGFDLTGL